MIKIITDSTAYMTEEYAKEHNITIVPLRYIYKDKEYTEGWPGTYDEFFEDFVKTKIFPKTSQPSLETFINEYNNSIDNGDEVLVFTISSSLSGTFNVANLAKEQCKKPDKVTVIDSQGEVQTIVGYIMEAVELRDKNASRQEIVDRINVLIQNSGVTFIPDSLDYLVKGGRIGKVSATIGTILQLKPIIIFKNGVLSNKKSIGLQKTIKDMLALIPQTIKRLFIIHVANTKFFEILKNAVNEWLSKLKNKDNIEIYEGEVGPVTASHVGPAIGLAWISE